MFGYNLTVPITMLKALDRLYFFVFGSVVNSKRPRIISKNKIIVQMSKGTNQLQNRMYEEEENKEKWKKKKRMMKNQTWKTLWTFLNTGV